MEKEIDSKFLELIEIVEKLRSENGCPWDRAQTIYSIRENIIEEAYELVDAITESDPEHIKEELGDLLFLVIFAGQLAKEKGLFSHDDIINMIKNKLIYRHPHVFGDKRAKTKEEALSIWKEQKGKDGSKTKLPKRLPFFSIMLKLEEKLPILKEERFDLVVGIKRGGIIPSSILSYKLGLPLSFVEIRFYEDGPMPDEKYEMPKILSTPSIEIIKNRRILLVDDIENTGKTMNKAKEVLSKNASYIKSFSIIGRHTDYYLFLKEECVRLPWF